LQIPQFEETAFLILQQLVDDPATDSHALNRFLGEQIWRHHEEESQRLCGRLQKFAGKIARKNLESRFQRYVLDTTWSEWENYEVEESERDNLRPRKLVRALAKRVASDRRSFDQLLPLLVATHSQANSLFYFGEALAAADQHTSLLSPLLAHSAPPNSTQCLGGYLNALKRRNPEQWRHVMLGQLSSPVTAVQGAELVWRTGFDDEIFDLWLSAYKRNWIDIGSFGVLRFGKTWQQVPKDRLVTLLKMLADQSEPECIHMLVDLLDQLLDDEIWIVDTSFVLQAVASPLNFVKDKQNMHGFHWNRVCEKLARHDPDTIVPLLNAVLLAMVDNYRLSYDQYVEQTAHMLCQADPNESWTVVANHLLSAIPQWHFDILNWLKGGLRGFGESLQRPPIAEFPLETVLAWIAEIPSQRASMIAHAAPSSLEEHLGGALTRALLDHYSDEEGVLSGISANFHSGVWVGPESQYLRKKRDQFRNWLGKGFTYNVYRWIENEIQYLDRRIESCEIEEEREQWSRPTS